ncbi:hypothetical protein EBR66_02480 [bacterium]|nr:hypothetical protein [bacterium]
MRDSLHKKLKQVTRKKHGQPMPGPSQCHPSMGKVTPPHGCIPLQVLQKVAHTLAIPSSYRGRKLRNEIGKRLNVPPGAERTLLNKLPIDNKEKADLAYRYLRPAMPKEWISDPDAWLDSTNIANVLNQYEDAYPSFEFMGPFPIDFAAPNPYKTGENTQCLMTEICEIRVQKALENGTRHIGIVYNLDPHYKSGSHWVANFIDVAGHACYYFDSYGMEPPAQIARFMKWLTTQDPNMKLFYNARRIQYSSTECGVYCIYCIIRMLEGDTFTQITRRKPKDSDMLDLRDWLFST